jgi:uncharacterized protein YgiM (DUF1202 family)
MKKHCWLTLGLMVATVAAAQNNTSSNSLPAIPAPVTSPAAESTAAPAKAAAPVAAPAKQKPKKHAVAPAKAVALKEPAVALVPGAASVTVSNLIVLGQAGLRGELVSHLLKGDAVTVLSQINLDKHAAGEPAQWAKIALPSTVHVWLNGKFIDTTSKTVSVKKLNLRAGPGENYSVVGLLEKGAPVSELETKGDWIKIDAPTNAYAFVAAMYLKQEAAAPVETSTTPPVEAAPVPAPTPTPVPEAQPIVTEPAATPAPVVPAPEPAAVDTNVPPTPRIATHEGVVRHVGSIITPTAYELYDPATDKNVDFLHTTSTNLDLSRYVGMRIVVTGEESLAARWSDIPVLTIQSIQVIDTNAVPKIIYRSPRQSQLH